MTARRLRELADRHWPLLVGLAVVLVHLCYLVPGGPWTRRPDALILGQDEGTVLYDSLRVARGEVMYRDFFEFQGPVFYYVNGALFVLTGPSMTAARLLHIVVTAFAAACLAVLVARFAGRLAGIAAAAIHACLLLPMWPFAYSHWLADALALGGLVVVLSESPRPRDLVGGGALLGASMMTIQSLGLPVLVAVAGTLTLPGLAARDLRRALVRPGWLLLGAACAVFPILLYFALFGALDDLWYAMFVWTRQHYGPGQGPGIGYAWWVEDAIKIHKQKYGSPWKELAMFGLRLTQILPFFALAGAAVTAPRALWRLWKRDGRYHDAAVGGAALAAVVPLWLAGGRPDLTHVAYLGGFGLLGAAVLVHPLTTRWRAARVGVAALFGLCALGTVANYAGKIGLTWEASRKMADWRGESLKLTGAREIERVTAPGDTIVVGAMGGFYYLHIRPAAVPNTYIPAGWVVYLAEAQWQRLADEIVTRRPRAMMFIGKQWGEIKKRRPELDGMYRNQGGLLIRID